MSTVAVVYFTSKDNKITSFASQKENLPQRAQELDCSDAYKSEVANYPACVPEKCGRIVTDELISAEEIDILLTMAQHGFSFGGSNGGASILDLHSGALSHQNRFINIYHKTNFTIQQLSTYKLVKSKIHHAITHHFGVEKMYLTHPTFFSKLTDAEAQTIHDQYWHIHVDKETYPSFHFTSLLYLNDYMVDFKGGRFVFTNPKNVSVEPKKGRVSMFTSGGENPHYVEKVSEGVRYAVTISFTCDVSKAIKDPENK